MFANESPISKEKDPGKLCKGQCKKQKFLEDMADQSEFADWAGPDDMLATFGSADLLGHGSNRIVFDIGGNNYRMICKYHFGSTRVHLYIKWVGTHAEYDQLLRREDQYTIDIY